MQATPCYFNSRHLGRVNLWVEDVVHSERLYNVSYGDTVQNSSEVLHGEMDVSTSDWEPLAAVPFSAGRYDTDPPWHCVDAGSRNLAACGDIDLLYAV